MEDGQIRDRNQLDVLIWWRLVTRAIAADAVSAVQSPWCSSRGLLSVSRWAQWTHCVTHWGYSTSAWR
jgi:hypothetical protein